MAGAAVRLRQMSEPERAMFRPEGSKVACAGHAGVEGVVRRILRGARGRRRGVLDERGFIGRRCRTDEEDTWDVPAPLVSTQSSAES